MGRKKPPLVLITPFPDVRLFDVEIRRQIALAN